MKMPLATLSNELASTARSVDVGLLHARSVDARFLRRLKTGAVCGNVHSVFERAINIQDTVGGLFTLVCRDLDNGPNAIVVDVAGFGGTGVTVRDPVTASPESLRIGSRFAVRLEGATGWDGRLPAYPRSEKNLRANLCFAEAFLSRLGEAGGVVGNRRDESRFSFEVTALLERRATLLRDSMSVGDLNGACLHAKSMVGLGPGLTPSGDDFLVGLFAVLNISESPCFEWLGGGREVVADARHSTNAISYAVLTQAACGRVRESIARLVNCMMHATPDRVLDPLHRVLAIGSTSGADLLAGILSGFQVNLKVGALKSVS